MFMFSEILLAALLIKSDIPPTSFGDSRQMLCAVQIEAINMQILGQYEKTYILSDPLSFEDDVVLIRRRYQEIKDAPLISDLNYFPDKHYISKCINFNKAYTENMLQKQMVNLHHREEYQDIIDENKRLLVIYEKVSDCYNSYNVYHQRMALKDLRCLIGEENFYNGKLPEYVTFWSFTDVK